MITFQTHINIVGNTDQDSPHGDHYWVVNPSRYEQEM